MSAADLRCYLQVSAEVLRHLLQLASQHLSGDIPDQVVITVPAYFDGQQRAATLEAARLAGIKKVGLQDTHTLGNLNWRYLNSIKPSSFCQ